MHLFLIPFLVLHAFQVLDNQEITIISGKVLDNQSKEPLSEYTISIEGTNLSEKFNTKGDFRVKISLLGEYILNFSSPDFITKRIPITLESNTLNLGYIYMDRDITMEKTNNLVTLTEADLSDEDDLSASSGLLQATKDIFLNRAAFDFGQAFFRARGYDSRNGTLLMNGIPMNKILDGRPQWNNWGGLNDVTRNQEFTYGLQASTYNFGGILGTTNIDLRPSGFRPGIRLSSSASNRTYTSRLMATYSSGIQKNGLTYSVSASRRWAKEGYIDGTFYDAYSVFSALEYDFDQNNSIGLTAIITSNRRGRSSAITEEVYELAGSTYNPYWGWQNGEVRNARERTIREPIVLLNHYYKSEKIHLNTGIAYQFGSHARSRLGYYNAPNPDPTYYRYLPSFYLNSATGANFISANLAKEGFLKTPQLNWPNLYLANMQESARGKAAYILQDDTVEDKQFAISSIGNLNLGNHMKTDFGLTYKKLKSNNYAKIRDLLGADFHEDTDPFSNTRNNLNEDPDKGKDDIFNYHYVLDVRVFESFAQLGFTYEKWDAHVSGNYSNTSYQRDGLFLNERFPDNSFGKSEEIEFSNFGFKGGFTYKITGRHWVVANGTYHTRPSLLKHVFVNPRENNQSVPNIPSEIVSSIDLNYFVRLPKITGRVSGFYTRFQRATDINFFFVDAGVGSDFVQEVITNLDKLHMGTELGMEYQISPVVKLSAVIAIGKYLYASDPMLTINFDTAGADEDLIAPEGNIDIGVAQIKDYKLAQGPQKAFAFGLEYRDPKYWWVGMSANYLANNYASISTITRTQSFYLDPETSQPFRNATEENVGRLLIQNRLDDFYLLNIVGGKSWLINGNYISLFTSINNVFNTKFRTGGYEQSRNGNYGQLAQDNLSGSPSFAPKYWYGYGRTFFLNLAISF